MSELDPPPRAFDEQEVLSYLRQLFRRVGGHDDAFERINNDLAGSISEVQSQIEALSGQIAGLSANAGADREFDAGDLEALIAGQVGNQASEIRQSLQQTIEEVGSSIAGLEEQLTGLQDQIAASEEGTASKLQALADEQAFGLDEVLAANGGTLDEADLSEFGAVVKSDYSAHSILKADTTGAPTDLPVSTNELVGRAGGNIDAISVAEDRIVARKSGGNVDDLARADVQGILKAGAGALVKRTSNQSINDATWTAINFDAEVRDTDSIHDNVTNNTRLTVPTGFSRVRLEAQVQFALGSGQRGLWITKNGAAFDGAAVPFWPGVASVADVKQALTGVLDVSAGDYFELSVYQNTGGALNVLSGNYTWFSMELIK